MSKTHNESPLDSSPFDPVIKEQMPQPGDHLGHCRIIESIAAGGMANVYKVWQEQLEVVRAIKILKPGFDEESKSRLETEAKISANLKHHNIVDIYEMGFWNDIPFIEMEYVDGLSLKELLEKNGRFSIQFSIAVIHALCSALQFAHDQDLTLYGKVYDNLIHRDIKPANILISTKGIVKLADFGIARPSDVSLHTVGGKVMGTFAYLSPEQLNGERLDQRSDIYALGAVLYEMITGTKTYPQKMLTELVQRKSSGQYIPAISLCKDISKQLNAAIDKSLSYDRAKRYQSAAEFDHELTSSLKKVSQRQFEETIHTFVSNPVPLPRQAPLVHPSHQKILWFVVILFLVFAISGIYLTDHYWDKIAIVGKPSVAKKKVPAVVPPDTIKNSAQETKDASAKEQTTKIQKKSTTVSAAPSASKAVPENQISKAIATFKTGDYIAAIDQFQTLRSEALNVGDKDLLRLFLLQAYIKNGESDKALELAASEECSDGYYYYLAGEQLYKKNSLEKAESSFKKARALPTQFEKNTPSKASLYLARIRDGLYMMKPNIDNKQLCIRAWSTYIDMYCANDQSQECTEANERLSTLAAKIP